MKIVQEKQSGTAQKILLASCDATVTGLQAAYKMMYDAYGEVQKGNKPDFTGTIPFPPPPPSPPSSPDQGVSWFQLAWNIIESALDLAAQKSPKLAEIMGPLSQAGDQLVKDLDKYFGPPHAVVPMVFPAALVPQDLRSEHPK